MALNKAETVVNNVLRVAIIIAGIAAYFYVRSHIS